MLMNKKLLALPFLWLFLNSLVAQNSTFTFWIESNTGISDRLFVNDGSIPDAVVEIRSNLEKVRLGYELGLLVEYPLTDRWSVQSGMKYVNWGCQTGRVALNPAIPGPEFPQTQKTKTQNVYLEIPIRVNYKIPLGKGRVLVWGGYSPSYNVRNTITTRSYYTDEAITEKRDDPDDDRYRRVNLVAELGLGWQVPLSDKLGLRVGPNVRLQTLGQVDEVPLNRQLTFYGLALGIQFK